MNSLFLSKVVYELVRSSSDRLQMEWEDDRSRLIEETQRILERIQQIGSHSHTEVILNQLKKKTSSLNETSDHGSESD